MNYHPSEKRIKFQECSQLNVLNEDHGISSHPLNTNLQVSVCKSSRRNVNNKSQIASPTARHNSTTSEKTAMANDYAMNAVALESNAYCIEELVHSFQHNIKEQFSNFTEDLNEYIGKKVQEEIEMEVHFRNSQLQQRFEKAKLMIEIQAMCSYITSLILDREEENI